METIRNKRVRVDIKRSHGQWTVREKNDIIFIIKSV